MSKQKRSKWDRAQLDQVKANVKLTKALARKARAEAKFTERNR